VTDPAAPGPVVAAIIAGGRGTRLGGRRKGQLLIGGRSILDRQLAVLRPLFPRILLVDNDPATAPPDVEVIGDRHPSGQGPLAGLDAVLSALRPDEKAAVCVAGDMPFLHPGLLALLRDHRATADAVVPLVSGFPEPLCARYGRPCAKVIAAALAAGHLRTSGFLSQVATEYLPEPTLRALDPQLLTLENVNTPEDLARLEALASQLPPV
jgi:molybdopterin-guanine dinucleotide biosynthesis protein A